MPHDAAEPAVVLGRNAAEVLKKKVGDKIQIETAELSVVGIVDGNAWVENGSIILALPVFQEITGNPDKINVIDIRVTPSTSAKEVDRLCKEINQVVPEGRAVVAGENISQSEAYRMVQAMSWGTSLLAVLVGVLGVMNTMLMTVFERTQEICVLLALGWRRGRIIRMVLVGVGPARFARRRGGRVVWRRGRAAFGHHPCHPRTPGTGPQHSVFSQFLWRLPLPWGSSADFTLPGAVPGWCPARPCTAEF